MAEPRSALADPVAPRLRGGEQLLGTFLQIPHRAGGEVAGALGLDFVCVDAEHSVLGPDAVCDVVAGAQLAGCPCLVRVAANEPAQIASALDAGAGGVIVPRVESAAEAARAVAAARYPPRGTRGAGPSRATGYGVRLDGYLRAADDALLVGVQIESSAAVQRADEIAAVEGVDLVFAGPGDLAVSLGGADGWASADIEPAIGAIFDAARRAGRASGIFAPAGAAAARALARGAGLVIVSSDLGFLVDGARRALAEARP